MKKEFLKKASLTLAILMATSTFGASGLSAAAFADPPPEGAPIVWNFEDGTLGDFKVTEGSFGTLISDIPYDHNSPIVTPYPREGNYHLTTLETDKLLDPATNTKYPPESLDKMTKPSDAYKGVVMSPMFRLDEPKMNFLVGGGNSPEVYVALCDVYGREIMKANSVASQEMMTRVNWDLSDYDMVGQYVFLKIVDNSTGAWGHITFDDFHAVGYVDLNMEIQPEPPPDLIWDFEDGVLLPFTVAEGAFGETVIAAWDYDRNTLSTTKIPNEKQGKYYLCTVETDTTLAYDESYQGAIHSPTFLIQDSKIQLKLAGGKDPANYVAVCRASDNEELARVTVPEQGNIFHPAELDLKENYRPNEPVYIKIVDGTTSGYGFISVDDIHAKGVIVYAAADYQEIQWSFEDGTLAPFTANDTFGKLIVDRDLDRNDNKTPMNKDGKYYLSTVEIENPALFNESYTGSITSPIFLLDPAAPTVRFRMSGGTSAANYVALCDAVTDRELVKLSPAVNGHPMREYTLSLENNYTEGQGVYIKIVDGTTSGWGFIQVDDFRFKGEKASLTYESVRWSFETGTILPFTTNDTFGKLIVDRDVDRNDKVTPINKHGKYFLSTVDVEDPASYNESFTGTLRTPAFCINPDDAVIRLKLAGGPKNYVAVCRARDGAILEQVSPKAGSHVFKEVTLDLTGRVGEGELVYLAIVDNTTQAWAFITVDDIRASVAFKPESPVTSETELSAITGWTISRFNKLKAMLQDLIDTYGAEYPQGSTYLEQVNTMQLRHTNFWKQGATKPSDPVLAQFKTNMDKLERDAVVSNPLLTAAPIAFVTRQQYAEDHHNTHNMIPNTEGEINSSGYLGGGALKVIDFAQDGGTVYTLKEDDDGVFRDPDVSYDGDKILVSYRQDLATDSYNIYEYTLNEGKTEIVEEKQLTSMRTADDMDPMYMPSGNIVFAGTRDPKYVMCNRHIAANLYRMEGDGANIVKITNSTLFERPTDVLPDGRILYDRWEYNDRDFGSAQGLWTVNEDGTEQVTYYGNNSPTGATIDAKAIPGTQNVIAVLSSTHDVAWGGLAIIDHSQGVDGRAPVIKTWPDNIINGIGDPNKHGNNIDAYKGLPVKYEDPQPLNDTYFIASRQIPGQGRKMGLYLLDLFGNETLLYEDDTNRGAFDANVLAPRNREIVQSDRRNYNDNVGSFFVQNVYEGTHMQGVAPGTVKSLRVVESMEKRYISQSQQWGGEGQQNPGVNWHSFEVKRVLGEVPVYEDGSAYFEVPQDVFVYFQLLDEDGRMIQSMRSGTLVQSGEKTGCIGCHDDRRTAPISDNTQKTPMALEANVDVVPNPDWEEGSPAPKTIVVNTPDKPQKRVVDFAAKTDTLVDYDNPDLYPTVEDLPSMNFLTEVQPIFTENCISCHGYDTKEAGLTLVPDKNVIFNASYVDLWRSRNKPGVYFGNLLGVVGGGGSEFISAKGWGSYASPLVQKIYEDPAHAARLTDAEKRRVAEWVDLNAPYYGDYASNYGYNPGGRSPLTGGELSRLGFNLGWGWGERSPALIYFDNPEKSPILQRFTPGTKAYTDALGIIETGLTRLRNAPDIDWRGADAVPGNPALSVEPWQYCALDQWRTEKSEMRAAIEAANRAAVASGAKRYDSDNAADGLEEWPAGFPGWPTEANEGK